MCSHWNSAAARPAPASAEASQWPPSTSSGIGNQASKAPPTPLSAPRPMAASHWPAKGSAPSGRLSAQATSSHSSTAGKASADPPASNPSQACAPAATNITPTATTACTSSKARNTTPTWQTSNTEAGPACAGAAGASVSSTVGPKPVVGSSDGRGGASARLSSCGGSGFMAGGGSIESMDGTSRTLSPTPAAAHSCASVWSCALRVVHHTPWPATHSTRSPRPGRRCFQSR